MEDAVTYTNEKRKSIVKKLILIFLIFMLLVTFFSNTIKNMSNAKVKYELPTKGYLVKKITGKGSVEAKNPVLVFIDNDIERRVLDIKIKIGDKVKKGQELVIFQKKDVSDELKEAEILYEQKKLSLEKLKEQLLSKDLLEYERTINDEKKKLTRMEKEMDGKKELFALGAISKYELETSQNDLEDVRTEYAQKMEDYSYAKKSEAARVRNLQRDIKSCEYEIELAELSLKRLKKDKDFSNIITAPCDGIVKEINISVGNMVNNTKSLCSISDPSRGFNFVVPVDTDDLKYISIGDNAEVHLKSLSGKVVVGKIINIKDDLSKTGEKKELIVDLSDENLIGGESGEIYISKTTRFYDFLVPNSSINEDKDGRFVYIIKEKKGPLGNSYFVQRASVITDESDNTKTSILNGLDEKDKVVTNRDRPVYDGNYVVISD